MRLNKKASLELSMNSIVILILAIVLLGLGLSFMRNLFENMGSKVSEAVDATKITNPPTDDTPLTLTPPQVSIKKGKIGKVDIAFMNTLPLDQKCSLKMYDHEGIVCDSGNPCPPTGSSIGDGPVLIYQIKEYDMTQDQINMWTISIGTNHQNGKASPGTYIISAEMGCDDSSGVHSTFQNDLVIEVTQ